MRIAHPWLYALAGVSIFMFGFLAMAPQCREHWRMMSVYREKSQPIQFFGRVVDQRGNPIAGAQVVVSVSTFNPATLFGSKEYLREQSVTCTTDRNGAFVIQDVTGSVMNIQKFSHPDYVAIPERKWDNRRYEAMGYRYARDRGVPYYVPDPQKPAVFPLRKEGEERILWPSRGGRDEPNPW